MQVDTRFSTTAIAMHWIAALLILAAIGLGVYMTGLELSPARLRLYNWHKWLGVTVLGLSAVRLAWRLTHRPPPDLDMPRWQQRAAHASHCMLYALCLLVPLAGWTYSSASGFPVVVFGLLPLPDLVAPDRELAQGLKTLHASLALALGTVIALHVLAVVKHQLLDGDRILARMVPRIRRARP